MSLYYKKNRWNEDRSVDDWLMTYADMITLLLCFFAIFLSVSVPRQDAFRQMRSKVMEKFAAGDSAGKMVPAVSPDMPRGAPNDVLPLTAFPSIVGDLMDEEEKPDVAPGDRISSIDMNSASFFAVGSATLSDEGKKILDTVLATVRSDEFKDYQITIEGHTDDSPINTLQFPSNWELSTGRAAAVARYFLEQGVTAQRLRASGYADTVPKAPNRDAAGKPVPDNQAQNRRVVIKLEKIEKDR